MKELKLNKSSVVNELSQSNQTYVNHLNDCKLYLMQTENPLADNLLKYLEIMDLNLTTHKFELDTANETSRCLRNEIKMHKTNLDEMKVKSYGGYLDLCNMIQILKFENSLNQENY